MGQEIYATNVDGAGTDLRWNRTVPLSGGPQWPAVLVVHGGHYKAGTPGPGNVAQDVTAAGYLSFQIEYRLAPPHNDMPLQVDPPSDGRPPQQTNDVKKAIQVARADSQCNGKVVVLGFSAGGSHGGFQTIAGTTNDDKPDVFIGYSGLYDNDNADVLASSSDLSDVQNYINHLLTEGAAFHTAARASSAYWQTPVGTPCPSLLFNSTSEIIPSSVYTNMVTLLTGLGGTLENHLRTGTEHSSSYWLLSYGGSFPTVKECSLDFISRMLSFSPPPVQGPASIVVQR